MKKIFIIVTLLYTVKSKGQTIEELICYMDSLGICHKEIVLKQAIHETGNFSSYCYKERNNLFGMTNGKGKYKEYSNWRESIEAYKKWQDKMYDGYKDYYQFLNCLKYTKGRCLRYAEDPHYTSKLKKIKLENVPR